MAYVYRDQDIPKPQTSFAVAPSNFDSQPFQPFLTIKPHALKSLDDSRVMFTDENGLDQCAQAHQYQDWKLTVVGINTRINTRSMPINIPLLFI